MDMHLVVVRPFGDLARGDIVTDAVRISRDPEQRTCPVRRARCRRPANKEV